MVVVDVVGVVSKTWVVVVVVVVGVVSKTGVAFVKEFESIVELVSIIGWNPL